MVYEFLVDGVEEVEALVPIDILRRVGIDVKTVALYKKVVVGSHNIPITADIMIDEIDKNLIDMIILPGGPGHTKLDGNEKLQDIIDFANETDSYIASICAAPSIIGKKGLLKGKKATCFPGYEKYLDGAILSGDKVCKDGKFITGKGAGAAFEFAFCLAECLADKNKVDDIRESIQY